jgi:RNase P/RNase MRP subunit POP5
MPEKLRFKPTMKENKRYLLLNRPSSKEEIESIILDYLGILGYAKTGFYFIDKNIIAVNREQVNNVRAALAISKSQISVKKVSGTLKGLKRK